MHCKSESAVKQYVSFSIWRWLFQQRTVGAKKTGLYPPFCKYPISAHNIWGKDTSDNLSQDSKTISDVGTCEVNTCWPKLVKSRKITVFTLFFIIFLVVHTIRHPNLAVLWGKGRKTAWKQWFFAISPTLINTCWLHTCPRQIWFWEVRKDYLKRLSPKYHGPKPHTRLGGSKKPKNFP